MAVVFNVTMFPSRYSLRPNKSTLDPGPQVVFGFGWPGFGRLDGLFRRIAGSYQPTLRKALSGRAYYINAS